MQQITNKKTPQLKFVIIIAAAVSVALIFTITPWNIVPTQVSEDVAVIKVTDYGCVGESSMGRSVVVPNCDAAVGDIVSATFYIPAGEINGYLEELESRQNPMVDAWDRNVSGIGFSP
ncbi:hypothetical protein [Nitrosopumilus sp.]|uniref:hypothetical protein n=1 Tax=Nitrosopumilus sp. TaxID=2024843 RepID=UPI00292F1087|nr:hypothetical protein [Nitrosopumilus sp.]